MEKSEIEKHKRIIDSMSQVDMARKWRFASMEHPYFDTTLPLFDYFSARFDKLGGFTPAISKQIGW